MSRSEHAKGRGWAAVLAWLPAVLYSGVVVVALAFDPRWVAEPRWLLPVLNLVFRLGVGVVFAYVAARAYLTSGALPTLALGTGMLVMGVGSTLAAHLVTLRGPPMSVPMHTLAVLLAGVCLLAAGLFTLLVPTQRLPGQVSRHLAVAYATAAASQGLVLALVLGQRLPPFFVPGQGSTALGELLLTGATVAFLVAALLFALAWLFTRLAFFGWYAVGLALFGVGLAVLLRQTGMGSLVTFAGRWGQFLGGAYLLGALVQATRAMHDGQGLARAFTAAVLQSTLPYRPLVESAAEAVIALDPQGRVLYWNEAAARRFGCPAPAAFGRDLLDLIRLDGDTAAVRAAIHVGGGPPLELVLHDAEGRPFPAEASFYVDPRHSGLTVCSIRDLTERKRAEAALRHANEALEARVLERTAALRASEERYRALFESATDAIVVTDPAGSGRVLDVNAAACRLFGYAKDEFQGLDRAAILDVADPSVAALLGRRGASRRAGAELTYRRKDGSRFHGELTTALFTDGQGQQRAVAIIRDITARRRAEDEVRTAALFPEQNPDPILRIDRKCVLLYANRGAAAVLTAWAAAVGQQLDTPECRALLAPLQTGAPTEVMVEWRGRVYSLVSIPVTEAGYVNVYGRDITERQRGEEKLRAALAEKEAALATNQTLLREVHHRVKNNLQMLCDMLYLQMEGMADAEKAAVLRDTYSRIYAIARLHEQLYHAMKSGEVQLADYVQRLLTGFASVYRAIPVQLEVGDDRVALDLDRAIHTGLIINELVTNALKHAFPPGQSGKVAVRVHRVDDTVELQVRDTGKGLPADLDLSSTKTLGLRIVRILAQRLGATVSMESHRGTVFTIGFPLHAEAPVEPKPE
jgi:PAS domain S-box-containing protein